MKKNEILILLIPTLIIVIVWVGFSIYHNSISPTIPEEVNSKLSEINPKFDTKVIEDLKQRENVTPVYSANPIVSPTPTDVPPLRFISPTPVVTQQTQQASSGGVIAQ